MQQPFGGGARKSVCVHVAGMSDPVEALLYIVLLIKSQLSFTSVESFRAVTQGAAPGQWRIRLWAVFVGTEAFPELWLCVGDRAGFLKCHGGAPLSGESCPGAQPLLLGV